MNRKKLFSLWGRKVKASASLKGKSAPPIYLGSWTDLDVNDHFLNCTIPDEEVWETMWSRMPGKPSADIELNSRGDIIGFLIQDFSPKPFSAIYPFDFGDLKISWNGKSVQAWFTIKENRPFDIKRYLRPFAQETNGDGHFKLYCGGRNFDVTHFMGRVDLFCKPSSYHCNGYNDTVHRFDAYLGDGHSLSWERQLEIAYKFLKKHHSDLVLLKDKYKLDFKSICFFKVGLSEPSDRITISAPIPHPGPIPEKLSSIVQELGIKLHTNVGPK